MINRIREIITYSGLSDRAFAHKCSLNQPTLFNQLKGIRAVSLSTITSILTTFPEVSSEWLLRGDGNMLISNQPQPQPNTAELDRIDKLTGAIESLQEVIKSKNDIITAQQERIKQLESQLKKQ